MKRGLNWWWLALRFTIGGEERESDGGDDGGVFSLSQSLSPLQIFFFSEIVVWVCVCVLDVNFVRQILEINYFTAKYPKYYCFQTH